jgi:hypothetical protein
MPHLIRNEEDLDKYLDELSRHDMLEYIRQQRPDTKWVVHLLSNVSNSPGSKFLKIKPNKTLILKADVCCVKIWRTISGKVEDAISFKLNYASPGHGFHYFTDFEKLRTWRITLLPSLSKQRPFLSMFHI